MVETTALGAAMAAGHAEGVRVWDLDNMQPTLSDTFYPVITEEGKLITLKKQIKQTN